ncbi:hypothetical protein Bca52824_071176 [Brassica carinata]|uniref:Tr-type G domain-containing protein n=1 Tax=Brassica carinata TaxID=52824 RepID=A0A8X7Q688_BRACI|nr:hypothetical protein Bca52824_071176 [Brassica carinata]
MDHNHINSKQAGNCVDSGFLSSHLSSLEGKEFKGVEAQTLANVYLALENNLEIVHVVNKIDLPGAEPEPKASSQGD